MKNPNGYGGISKLPGNRRKPYRVRLTAGWQYQTDGKPLQKYHTLGYYTSRRAALIALADYNKRPYDLNLQHITLGELYNQWYDKHTVRLSRSSRCSFTAAWKKCTDIANEPIKKVKKAQMQAVLDNNQHLSPSVQTRLKTIFNGIFRLALENDLINVDYSRYLEKNATAKQTSRSIFTHSEIKCLWKNLELTLPLADGSRHHYNDVRLVDTVLIMLYSGIRIGELLEIQTAHIDLKKQIIDLHGTKTKAAHRILPLHKDIVPLVAARMHGKYLIETENGQPIIYDTYKKRFFNLLMSTLKMQHKPHDCRHTFISGMDSCGISAGSVILKRIVGHANADVTESYTHKNRKGFTLVELVVVIAILGILAGLAIPRFMDATASARGARIVADMRTIDSAIMMYNAKTGNLPANIAAITTDNAANGQYKMLAAWPTPPTGRAIVTASNGAEKELTVISGDNNKYTLDADNGRALYGGESIDKILTNSK